MEHKQTSRTVAACRVGVTPEELAREAERSVLYGALLAAQRPGVRLKPALAEAALALLPAVRAFLAGEQTPEAAHALAYAQACGAEAFLRSKRDLYAERGTLNEAPDRRR